MLWASSALLLLYTVSHFICNRFLINITLEDGLLFALV